MVYFKVPDSTGSSDDSDFRGQRGETYFVEKTLNPKWSGQRFLFKVKPTGKKWRVSPKAVRLRLEEVGRVTIAPRGHFQSTHHSHFLEYTVWMDTK